MPRWISALLVLVASIAGACGDDAKSTVDKSVSDLRPGDCFDGSARAPENAAKDSTVLVVGTLPCSKTHEKEVFAVFQHSAPPGAVFPGEKEVTKVAQDGCAERFAGYVGRSFEDSKLQVSVIAPGPAFWDKDDRTIVCILLGDKPLKGSQKAGGS